MAEGKILIVDDNPTNLRVLLDYLEKSGFEVLVAPNGERAIRQLERIQPELILLDVLMPGINGFETCLRLKQNEKTKNIPVIFMTALTDMVDKIRGFEVGGVDYLTKPLHYQEVLVRVNTHLKIQRLQNTLKTQNILLEENNRQLQQEIVERKHAEKDLKNTIEQIELAKQEWESTADSLSHVVCLLDEHGRIIRANRTVELWNLGKVQSVKGKAIHTLLHGDCSLQDCQLKVFLTHSLTIIARQQSVEKEFKDPILHRYLAVQIRPVSSNAEKEERFSSSFAVCSIHDITQRRHTQKALQQRTRELYLLNQLSDHLQACQNEEETYDVVVKVCTQLFPLTSGSLCVMDTERTTLQEVASWGNPPDEIRTFGVDDPWIFDHEEAEFIELPHTGRLYTHIGYSLNSKYLCAPISASGEILAILSMDFEPDYRDSPESERLQKLKARRMVLTGVAEHYALSLANLRLRETLRKEAIVDPLTGLYNRRHMEASLSRESRRAQRHNSSLGFMMLDVDHFKKLNDSYSHEAGDVVLKELGLLLQRHIRGEDIACRYGGEEFLLILPEASLEDTRQRAEELRKMVKKLRVHYHEHVLTVTISSGVAALPKHGLSPKDVVSVADAALYQAKAEGRDRVVVALCS